MTIAGSSFLSFDSYGSSETTGGLGVLSSDLESPFVSATFVTSDFEHSFDVFSEFGLQDVRGNLKILTFLIISISVQEPSWDSVTFWISDDAGNGITLLLAQDA